MPGPLSPPRKLIIGTLIVFAIVIGITLYHSEHTLPDAIQVNAKGQPTIGFQKAKVHVVVFEEPKCPNCRDFNNKIFGKLKEEFIDTNKISLTVIPVSFLAGSMPAAIATLCVYYADPLYPNSDLFFTYLDCIYADQPPENTDWATPDRLVQFGQKASPAINLQKLRKCIDSDTYRAKIVKNTDYGRSIMGGTIVTPTLYVNGIRAKELSYDSIQKLIKDVLEKEGVHE